MAAKSKIEVKISAGKKEKTVFTREQVIELLNKQKERCSLCINGNCTEFTAKKKVLEAKLVIEE